MSQPNPFDYINSITFVKNDMIRGSDDPVEGEKGYVPYMTNRQLSYFPDTLMYANDMNMNADLPGVMQYEYLFYSVSKKKRFSKWAKPSKVDDVEIVSRYFGYSKRRSEEALKLLTTQQLEQIRETLDPGGR